MIASYCMEALVSGVLLAGDVSLVHSENGLITKNENAYVLSSYVSSKEFCQNDRIVKLQPSIKEKIFYISN